MITLEQVLKNKASSEMPSEQILGKYADDFATFWDNNKDQLQIAKDALLVEFCQSQNFDADGLRLYRLGMDTMFMLFQQASIDRLMKIKLENKTA